MLGAEELEVDEQVVERRVSDPLTHAEDRAVDPVAAGSMA